MVRSGVAESQDRSAQTPAGAHCLVPESTGTLGSSSDTIHLRDLEQVTSHL